MAPEGIGDLGLGMDVMLDSGERKVWRGAEGRGR